MADGGEPQKNAASARAEGHALEGGLDGDWEFGGWNGGQVNELEAVQPVEAAEDAGGSAAEAAAAIEIPDDLGPCGHGEW